MNGTKLIIFSFGIFLPLALYFFSTNLLFIFAQNKLDYSLTSDLIDEQQSALRFTGDYFSDVSNPQFTVNTYETICKGYYTIENTGTELIYKGYGDLADEYTYVEQILPVFPIKDTIPIDVTEQAIEKPVEDIPFDTTIIDSIFDDTSTISI